MARTIKRRLTGGGDEPPIIGIDNQEFSKRLWNILTEKNMSQTELAKRVWNDKRVDARGYESWAGRDLISSYIRGKTQPSPQVLARIAKALNTTPEDLAPALAAKVVEKELPAMQITMIAGHADKCLLKVNKLVGLQTALKIGQLIEADEADGKGH